MWAGNSQLLASQLVLLQGGDPMSNRAKVSDISQEDVICEIRSKPGVLDDMRRGNAVFTKSSTYSTPAHSAESPSPRNAKSRPHLASIPAYASHHSSGPSTPATPATSGGGRKRKKRDRRASLFSNQNRASRDVMEDAAVAQGGMRRAAQVSPYSRYAPKQPFHRDEAAVRRSTSAQHAPPQEPVVLRGKAAASTKAIARSLSTATVTEQVTEALEYMFGPDEYAARDEERRRTRSPGMSHRSSSNPGRRECVHFSKTSQSPTSRSGSRRGRSSSVISSSRSPPYSPASGGTAHLFNSTSAPNESADTADDASPAALPTSRDPNQGQGRPATSSTNSTAAAAKPPLPFPLDHLPDDDDESALSGSGKVFAQLGLTHTSYTFGQTPPGRTHGETPLDRTYGSAAFSNFLTSHSSAEGVLAGERLRTTTYGASPFHLPEACPTQEPSKARRDGSYDAGAKRRRDEMRRWQREEEAVRRAKHESVVADQRRKEILDEITQEYAAAETRRARSGSAGSLSYDSSSLPPAPPETQGGSPVKVHKPAARSPPAPPVASPPPAHAPPAHYVAAHHHHHHVKESKAPRSKSPGTRGAPRSPSRRATSHTHPSPMSHHAHHMLSPTKKSTSHTHPSPLSPPKSNQARPRALSGMSRSTTGSPHALSPVTHPRSGSPPVRTKSPRRGAKAGKKKESVKSPPTPPAAIPATTPPKKAKGGESPSARKADSPPPPPPVVQNVRSAAPFKMFGVESDSESESHEAPKRQTRAAPPPRVGDSEEKEEFSYYPKRGDTGPSEPLRQPLSPKRSSSAALSPRARPASPGGWGKPPTTPSSSRASPAKRPPSPSSQDSSDNTKEVEVTGKPTVPRLHLGKQWTTPPVTPKQSPRQRADSVSKQEKFKREGGAARRETVAPKQEKKPKSPSLHATESEMNADERKGGRPDRPWHKSNSPVNAEERAPVVLPHQREAAKSPEPKSRPDRPWHKSNSPVNVEAERAPVVLPHHREEKSPESKSRPDRPWHKSNSPVNEEERAPVVLPHQREEKSPESKSRPDRPWHKSNSPANAEERAPVVLPHQREERHSPESKARPDRPWHKSGATEEERAPVVLPHQREDKSAPETKPRPERPWHKSNTPPVSPEVKAKERESEAPRPSRESAKPTVSPKVRAAKSPEALNGSRKEHEQKLVNATNANNNKEAARAPAKTSDSPQLSPRKKPLGSPRLKSASPKSEPKNAIPKLSYAQAKSFEQEESHRRIQIVKEERRMREANRSWHVSMQDFWKFYVSMESSRDRLRRDVLLDQAENWMYLGLDALTDGDLLMRDQLRDEARSELAALKTQFDEELDDLSPWKNKNLMVCSLFLYVIAHAMSHRS